MGLVAVPSSEAEASSCAGPLAAGEIRVVLVVDAADIGGGSSATCLVVPAGTTGSQLLARRGAELGTGSPRYGSSGLLCAIDGLPATGCGDRSAGGFAYWAYFNGSSGSWVYGNFNPFIRRLADGDVEGWRYVNGAGNGQDPPPRIGPSRALFPALSPVPVPEPEPSAPVAPLRSAPGVTSPPSIDVAEPAAPVVESVTTTVVSEGPVEVVDVALASSTSASTSGRWIGVLVALVLIGLLAGGAVLRTRRSR